MRVRRRVRTTLLGVAGGLALTATSACSPVEPDQGPDPASFHVLGEGVGRNREAELERYRGEWEEAAPPAYSFVLTRQCFCIAEVVRAALVEVNDGAVVRVMYADTGGPVPEEWRHLWSSVSGLFDLLEGAVDQNAETIRVAWDPALGYPTRIWIDYDAGIVDEELGFVAGELTSLP